jgi:hypothetical protein
MALADLLKDSRLTPPTRDDDLRRLTADFVRRRVRRLVELNPADADPARPGDITSAATRALADIIAGELSKVQAASAEILRRVAADPAHLPLDPATVRKRGTKRPPLPLKSALANRRRLVRCIVYQAAAADITLADPGGLDRLHRLCDRRLHIVERMLYDVGRVAGRAWGRGQIEAHRGGPWLDGYERLFEYPRVPRSVFLSACRPDQFGRCTAPMQAWGAPSGDLYLEAAIQSNPGTRASWTRQEYELDYAPAGGLDAVAAIQKLFQPSPDYLARNLMYCDHTIHALHLEALVFAMTKRGRGTAWLADEAAAQGPRWLRIHVPLNSDRAERFLGSDKEPLFFEHATVRQADLQVGDHLIVYNHPAYAKATVGGVWKLENAVVVQTSPALLMQGHGSPLRTQGGMWDEMISLFTAELDQRRADVEGLARVLSFGSGTLTVDTAKFLMPGIHVDIVSDDPGEAVLAADRQITAVTGRVIRYSGASASAPTRHRLRRARTKKFDADYEAIDGLSFLLVRRVAAAASQYDAASQKADWFLAWKGDAADEAIRKDAARAAFVKAQHLIDYTQERDGGTTRTIGWFPLWRPSRKGGGPLRRDGKIVRIEPVKVEQRQVAGWTWFFDPDPARRDLVPVVRPREL